MQYFIVAWLINLESTRVNVMVNPFYHKAPEKPERFLTFSLSTADLLEHLKFTNILLFTGQHGFHVYNIMWCHTNF